MTVWTLAWRNIQVYVRNRMSVFFSFLSVLIIIGLYALFLGKVQSDGLRSAAGSTPGVRTLVDSWIIAGLLAVNAVTVSLGSLGTMVSDVEYKRFDDFVVAPVPRSRIVVSYLIAACVIGFFFNLVAMAAGELYIVSGGGQFLGPRQALEAVGMLALAVASSASIMYLFASFLRSVSAFGILSTLLGTLIGFLTGVYVPVGVLPDAVQKVVTLVPFSHSAALLRQVFCEKPLAEVFAGVPPAAQARYLRMYGIHLYWGDFEVTVPLMIAVLAGVTVVFLAASALKLRGRRRS